MRPPPAAGETPAGLVAEQLAGRVESLGDCAGPLVLATVFGGLRVESAMASAAVYGWPLPAPT